MPVTGRTTDGGRNLYHEYSVDFYILYLSSLKVNDLKTFSTLVLARKKLTCYNMLTVDAVFHYPEGMGP